MLKLILLLVLNLAIVLWFIRNDAAEYAAFKKLTETADRQQSYRRWTLKSFLLFSGATLFSLAILQRLRTVTLMPDEFLPLAGRLRVMVPAAQVPDRDFLIGLLCAVVLSSTLLAVALARKFKVKHATLGDIEPLMPRNTAETGWTALLSLNAGLSEELFFRLLLPLLLAGLLHNALLAFALATLIFGLVHFYQGAVGILMTAILGAVLACVYVWTGNLWVAIAVHAGIDLLGLVVRPTIMRLLHRADA